MDSGKYELADVLGTRGGDTSIGTIRGAESSWRHIPEIAASQVLVQLPIEIFSGIQQRARNFEAGPRKVTLLAGRAWIFGPRGSPECATLGQMQPRVRNSLKRKSSGDMLPRVATHKGLYGLLPAHIPIRKAQAQMKTSLQRRLTCGRPERPIPCPFGRRPPPPPPPKVGLPPLEDGRIPWGRRGINPNHLNERTK